MPASQGKQQFRCIKAHTVRPYVKKSYLGKCLSYVGIEQNTGRVTNELKTSKYTIATFLPVNLFEQFSRVANLYFLFMAALQLIPNLSPTSWFTTVFPLVFVLTINAIKEAYHDINKHRSDDEVNSRHVLVITETEGEVPVAWRDVLVGDILKVSCSMSRNKWRHQGSNAALEMHQSIIITSAGIAQAVRGRWLLQLCRSTKASTSCRCRSYVLLHAVG